MIVYLHPHLRNNATQDLVAQLVEHLPFKERVLGSSPSQITEISSNLVGRVPRHRDILSVAFSKIEGSPSQITVESSDF